MKKNTIILFTVIALSAGIIIPTGFKIKEHKTKKQIKLELDSTLIPAAEKELNALVIKQRNLRDSIVYYNDLLAKQTQYSQIAKQVPKLRHIMVLLEQVSQQWHSKHNTLQDCASLFDSTFDTPQHIQQQLDYIENGLISKQVIADNRFDYITELVYSNLEHDTELFIRHDKNIVQNEYYFINSFYNSLKLTYDMLQVIDKSQTIINKKDLKQLEIKVGHLLQEFKKINTTYQANKTFEKLQTFKQDKKENGKLLNKQIKKLANLKTSYAVDKIYKSRQK